MKPGVNHRASVSATWEAMTCSTAARLRAESAILPAPGKVQGQPAALRVRFAPAWLSWLSMVWADYWVVDLDADYQWAVVGGPSRKYMWVLSRSPSMSRTRFDRIKERARQRGYPVERLVMAAPLD